MSARQSSPHEPLDALTVDRGSPVPLWFQVAQHFERAIVSGALPQGALLDNEIVLAERLGISRPTMRRAMEQLVDQGLVVRRRGIGTRVVQPKVRRPLELTSLFDDLAKTGRAPRTEIRSLEVGPAGDSIAELLGIKPDIPVTTIERIRYAGDEPLAIMHNAVPVDVVVLRVEDLEKRGLYEILRSVGRVPRIANQVVGAKAATTVEARLLGDARGAPMLTMTRTAWDESGRGVEYGSHVYRASRYSFELTLTC